MDPGRGLPRRSHPSKPGVLGSFFPNISASGGLLYKMYSQTLPNNESVTNLDSPENYSNSQTGLVPPWDSPAVRQSRQNIGLRRSSELISPQISLTSDSCENVSVPVLPQSALASTYQQGISNRNVPMNTNRVQKLRRVFLVATSFPEKDLVKMASFRKHKALAVLTEILVAIPVLFLAWLIKHHCPTIRTIPYVSCYHLLSKTHNGSYSSYLQKAFHIFLEWPLAICIPIRLLIFFVAQPVSIKIAAAPFISPPIDTYDPTSAHYRYKDELIQITELDKIGGGLTFFLEKLTIRIKRIFHKISPCFHALFYSREKEYSIFKMLLGFPFGVAVGFIFYFCVIDRLKLSVFLRFMLGAMTILILSMGYARSIKIRCITWLIFPCFFGKSGRTILLTMAIGAVLTGPVSNTMDNFKESVRAITCMTELMINLTMKRFELTGKPIFNIVKGFVGDSKMDELGKKVRSALSPVKSEVENPKETREAEVRSARMDAELGTNRHEAFQKMEAKNNEKLAHDDGGKNSKSFKLDSAYLKKLDYRCNDIWGMAVDTCKKGFSNAWDRCLAAIPIIGYFLCWPTKLDFFCYLVKLFPMPIKCDSSKILNQGFGGAYSEGDTAGSQLEQGTKVKLEYKVIPRTGKINAVNIQDVQKGLKNEFSKKQRFFNFIISMFQRILAFMFIRIFITSFQYYNNYISSINFDNFYITDYFRKIERRRRKKGRPSLIPLKKMEAKSIIEPLTWKLLPEEKKKFSKGTLHLLINILSFVLIFAFDRLIYEILSIVAKHSYVVYTQKGVHDISLEVIGTGIVAKMVRSVLKGFHEKTEVDQQFDNLKCLPFPTMTPYLTFVKVFGTICVIWLLLYFESYGLRLRRAICSFFFPKREKQRVLHLYNATLKKRAGYTRYIRHQVRRLAKEHHLAMEYDTFTALRQQCPVWLCGWLKLLGAGKVSCVACRDRQDKSFHFCQTPECSFAYCESCWDDLREHCYGCTPETDDESSLSEDGFATDKGRGNEDGDE